jgi:hypothetical protein
MRWQWESRFSKEAGFCLFGGEMRKSLLIVCLITMSLISVESWGADWKYAGAAVIPKGEESLVFFDTQSVEHLSKGNVKVWIKSVNEIEFKKIFHKNEKIIVDRSAKKLVNGYFPPYSLVNPETRYPDVIDIVTWEETMNSDLVQFRMKTLLEINCKEKKHRTLSSIFEYKGKLISSPDPDKWEYISPESNIETLYKILCEGIK